MRFVVFCGQEEHQSFRRSSVEPRLYTLPSLSFLAQKVGMAMSSNESRAYEIMTSLGVDYVLVIFGGMTGYSGDDINKFLWMVRIAEGNDHFFHEGNWLMGHWLKSDSGKLNSTLLWLGSPTLRNANLILPSFQISPSLSDVCFYCPVPL